MAKEIKTLTVKPNEDAQTIQNLQCFGWNLLSSQEVYNKDSHLESWGKSIYNVTQTMHYVKLTFERDPVKIRNYPQIRRLEDEYMAVPRPKLKGNMSKKKFKAMFMFIALLLVIITLLLSAAGVVRSDIVTFAIIAAICYFFIKTYSKEVQKYENAVIKFTKKRNQIAQQAEQYL